jgi:hypothetical protein
VRTEENAVGNILESIGSLQRRIPKDEAYKQVQGRQKTKGCKVSEEKPAGVRKARAQHRTYPNAGKAEDRRKGSQSRALTLWR